MPYTTLSYGAINTIRMMTEALKENVRSKDIAGKKCNF